MPAVAAVYHLIDVPVATNCDKLAEPQKACEAAPVGAGVIFIVTTTEATVEQPFALVPLI